MIGVLVEFGRIRALEPNNVSTVFDYSALHTQADSEERDLSFAGITNGLDLPFDSTLAKPTRYENTVVAGQNAFGTFLFDIATLNAAESNLSRMMDAGMVQRFVDRLVSVFVSGILADDGDANLMLRISK